jgi:hypothetical protein
MGWTIDQKVASVDRENASDFGSFAGDDERGIGEVHWQIGILSDELLHSPKIGFPQIQQTDMARNQPMQYAIGGTAEAVDNVVSLYNHRPNGE